MTLKKKSLKLFDREKLTFMLIHIFKCTSQLICKHENGGSMFFVAVS